MIPITQYLRPHGETRVLYAGRSKEIEQKAELIQDAGFRFEVEVLTTDQISITISLGDEDYAHALCDNATGGEDPKGANQALDRLIEAFDIEVVLQGIQEHSDE